ncbi:TPA: hypothetical protein DEP21_05530 [Patescibacteria group bacterium]|nr:hypothetical protein [Candidatus Gracilibacteria bacterium]
MINLRIFRHEKVYKYPIHLDILAIQNLFQDLVKETNKCENKPQKYNLIFNNCTS